MACVGKSAKLSSAAVARTPSPDTHFCTKISAAKKTPSSRCPFRAGLILTFVSFPGGAKQGEVPQGVLTTLALTEPAVIMMLQVCGLLALFAFPITKAVHEANLRKIAAQQADLPEVVSGP